MKCKFCDEHKNLLFHVYDNRANSDFLVCALHWNKLYLQELTDQLAENKELEGT